MNWATTRAFRRFFKAGFIVATAPDGRASIPTINATRNCRCTQLPGASFEEIGASGALRIGGRARAVESSGRPFDVGFQPFNAILTDAKSMR